MSIYDISRDNWMIILSFTGERSLPYQKKKVHLDLLVANNLYRTCKHFKFLNEFRYMIVNRKLWPDSSHFIWSTLKLNGDYDGPTFTFEISKYGEESNGLSRLAVFSNNEFVTYFNKFYILNDYHFYIDGARYLVYDQNIATRIVNKVFDDWKRSNDVSYDFLIEKSKLFSIGEILVRYPEELNITFDKSLLTMRVN